MKSLILTILIIFNLSVLIYSDKCNPHATLIETNAFYLTQPLTKNVTVDISNYAQAFPQLSTLISKFNENLDIYKNDRSIEATEPLELIPFTDQENVFILKNETINTHSFKLCSDKGGSVIRLNAKNRKRIIEILKSKEIAKTPIHALPFHSLWSFDDDSEIILNPERLESLTNVWNKSPPWLTQSNEILLPHRRDENNAETKPEDFTSPVLCTKPNNPWDLVKPRKKWYQLVPRITNVLSMLEKLKQAYELSSRTLKTVPTITQQIANSFSLILPDSFKNVLEFLTKFTNKQQWERTKGIDPFKNFVNTALKLARQLNQNPDSITKMASGKLKFSPPSINELNWRELFELDDSVYGIMGPVSIVPSTAYVENETIRNPVHFEATITARVYSRLTDKVTIYTVKPNFLHNEMAAIKTIVATPQRQIALPEEAIPLQCEWVETEQLKVCHKMSIQPVPDISTLQLTNCAKALMSDKVSKDFTSCPRSKVRSIPTLYRADCEPDHKATAIINSDSPVTLEFKCDGVHNSYKNITNFPTFITTPCEVNLVEGTHSTLALPQWNADFLQDQSVVNEMTIDTPQFELSDKMMLVVSVSASAVSTILILLVFIAMYHLIKCCKCPCKRRNTTNNRNARDNAPRPDRPNQLRYYPAIQVHEFPFSN